MDKLEQYILDNTKPEEALMRELERETYLRVINPRMISGHLQGKLLEMLVRMMRPKRVLEIGTFTGYSALSIARGLDDDAVLDTIEVDDELEDIAAKYFDRSECGSRIRQHIGCVIAAGQKHSFHQLLHCQNIALLDLCHGRACAHQLQNFTGSDLLLRL